MYCPECRSEYREGYSQCADCEVALVETLPPLEPIPDLNLVTVLEAGDPSLLAVAESLLREQGIPYAKSNEQLQDLFALGRLGAGFNPVTGPILLQVPEEHAEAALEILEDLESGEFEDSEGLEEPDEPIVS